jgi:hypothetical protein
LSARRAFVRRNERGETKKREKKAPVVILQKGVGAQNALEIAKINKFQRRYVKTSRGTPFLSPNIGASALPLDDFNLVDAKT